MKSVTNLMDELKKKFGSDYAVSKDLGFDRSAISQIRKTGQCSDETAIKIANALGMDEAEVLLIATMARSKGNVKTAWEKCARIAGYSACFSISFQSITYAVDSIMYIMLNRYRIRFS